MTIYLYVKTHRVTGLKYLGMTTKKDPHKYKGSGKLWVRHIKKHGYDVVTQILLKTESAEELRDTGLFFSRLWNVVSSSEWANLTAESGEGGDTSDSESYRVGMENRRSMVGAANPMYGRSAICEQSLRWFTDGVNNVYVNPLDAPAGFSPGRTIKSRAKHSEEAKLKMQTKRARSCVAPNGIIYPSVRLAASSYGVTTSAINQWIRRGDKGWKLHD